MEPNKNILLRIVNSLTKWSSGGIILMIFFQNGGRVYGSRVKLGLYIGKL